MDIPDILVTFLMGLVLGIFYFGGLWITVQKIPVVNNPALWTFVSFSFRIMIVLIGFYLVIGTRWENAVIALIGFILVRIVSVLWAGFGKKKHSDKVMKNGN